MKKQHSWTKEEIEQVRLLVPHKSNSEIAQYFGVTTKSIENVLCRNKFKRKPEFIKKLISEANKRRHEERSNIGKNNPNWKDGISRDNYRYKKIQTERYPERVKARRMVFDHIKKGSITKGVCEICNSADVHAHHDDYSKPLKVRWFCRKHHREHMHDNKH